MRRLLPLVFLIAGCGGGAPMASSPGPARTTALSGDAALDLTVAGGSAMDHTMTGTGSVSGSLSIPSENRGTITLNALFESGPVTDNSRPLQELSLDLAGKKAVAVGTTFRLDGKANTALYAELHEVVEGPVAGSAGGPGWTATGGTVEVAGLTATFVTLRLTKVTLTSDDATDKGVVTISGTVTAPVVH